MSFPTQMKKAIYLPTKQKTIIVKEFDDYVEILLDGEYKTVSREDVELLDDQTTLSSLDDLKESAFCEILIG